MPQKSPHPSRKIKSPFLNWERRIHYPSPLSRIWEVGICVCAMPRREEAIRPNLGRETVSWEYVNVYGSGVWRGGGVGYGPPPRINLAFLTLPIDQTVPMHTTKLNFRNMNALIDIFGLYSMPSPRSMIQHLSTVIHLQEENNHIRSLLPNLTEKKVVKKLLQDTV